MVHAVVQLLVVLLAVPAQYLISLWLNPNPGQNSVEVLRVVESLQKFGKKWLSLNTWLAIAQNIWDYLTSDTGECIAVEIFKYRSSAGHFAQSTVPRVDRPEEVKYHVGQVFQHKLLKYHGVIIGWDEQAKAPEQWFDERSGRESMEQHLPHYAVLVDTKEHSIIQDYVSQGDIEIVTNTEKQAGENLGKIEEHQFQTLVEPGWNDPIMITNKLTTDYFESFDGSVYSPRKFLRKMYPKD